MLDSPRKRRAAAALLLLIAAARPAAAHKGHSHSPSPSPSPSPALVVPVDPSHAVPPAAPPSVAPTAAPSPAPAGPVHIDWRAALFEHMHNKIVHFPIALGLAAAVLLLGRGRWEAYLPVAAWLLTVAALFGAAAYLSGG